MLTTYTAAIAATIVAIVGSLILLSNPSRAINRSVSTFSLHIVVWLLFLHFAINSHPGSIEGLLCVRAMCALSALLPAHTWVVKECLAGTSGFFVRGRFVRFCGWVIIGLLFAGLCFTQAFIPAHSTSTHRIYGWGYYAYIVGLLGLYGFLFQDVVRAFRRAEGGSRIGLQMWLGGVCATAFTILALMAIGALTHDSSYIRFQPLAAIVLFLGTAVAITTHRVFDARQIMVLVFDRSALVIAVALVAVTSESVLSKVVPRPIDLLATTAFALLFASWLNERLDRLFRLYPQAVAARKAAYDVSRRETRADRLVFAFGSILKGWSQSDHAVLEFWGNAALPSSAPGMARSDLIVAALKELKWATPERLARERSSVDRDDLADFLRRENLGLIVLAEGPSITVLAGIGIPPSRRSFT